MQNPAVWQSYTGHAEWKVHYWGKEKPSDHDHYRHPQSLLIDLGGENELEVIGLHMKSKINKKQIIKKPEKPSESDLLMRMANNQVSEEPGEEMDLGP